MGISTEPRSSETHLNEAINWLYASQDVTDTAGSSASYNLFLGWEPAYPETTGYIIPTLYDIASILDRPTALRRAEEMARWLVTTQLPSGGFPCGPHTNGNNAPCVFDTGQILRGLVRSYRETGEDVFKQSAISAIRWLAGIQDPDGSWRLGSYNSFSTAYTSRVSWALLDAAQKFNVPSGEDAAAANLNWVLDQQRSNGWFENCAFKPSGTPYLHTIAYTIRGLLEASQLLNGPISNDCLQCATAAADRLLQMQANEGPLKGAFDERWRATGDYHCLTGNAQMAIIWFRLSELHSVQKYERAAKSTVEFLKQNQTLGGPKTVQGGFRGSHPVWGPYMYFRYPNWACKFFIDAILNSKTPGKS